MIAEQPIVVDPAATAQLGIARLLELIGENPDREGLRDTPARVVRAFREMTSGYAEDPAEILARTFGGQESDEPVRYDELVMLRGIHFTSLCEHHLLPFVGAAHVGYLPGEAVVGLSKLARLVECFARRLQMQERLTQQIAQAIMQHLGARGAGVVIVAHHSCMGCRGVRKQEAEMVTSSMLGFFREDRAARSELVSLLGTGKV